MPSTIESIVSAYVRLKNRPALEDMRELRRTLKRDLEARSDIDPRRSLEQISDDLRLIEEGLEQLRPPAEMLVLTPTNACSEGRCG